MSRAVANRLFADYTKKVGLDRYSTSGKGYLGFDSLMNRYFGVTAASVGVNPTAFKHAEFQKLIGANIIDRSQSPGSVSSSIFSDSDDEFGGGAGAESTASLTRESAQPRLGFAKPVTFNENVIGFFADAGYDLPDPMSRDVANRLFADYAKRVGLNQYSTSGKGYLGFDPLMDKYFGVTAASVGVNPEKFRHSEFQRLLSANIISSPRQTQPQQGFAKLRTFSDDVINFFIEAGYDPRNPMSLAVANRLFADYTRQANLKQYGSKGLLGFDPLMNKYFGDTARVVGINTRRFAHSEFMKLLGANFADREGLEFAIAKLESQLQTKRAQLAAL